VGRVRLNDEIARRRIVLEAAYQVAQRIGLGDLNWSDVAAECEITTSISTAKRAFDYRIVTLRREVAKYAYTRRNRILIAQAKRLGFMD
jgi:hypothetical protein